MINSTTNTYTLKREIINFTNKISKDLFKPDRKFTADITYGMLSSGSCLMTDVADQLHEKTKKVNTVERLTRHLQKGISDKALDSYYNVISKWIHDEPVIHIDDSDIVKPNGYIKQSCSNPYCTKYFIPIDIPHYASLQSITIY